MKLDRVLQVEKEVISIYSMFMGARTAQHVATECKGNHVLRYYVYVKVSRIYLNGAVAFPSGEWIRWLMRLTEEDFEEGKDREESHRESQKQHNGDGNVRI